MEFSSFTLGESEVGWDISFPFPKKQRKIITNAFERVKPSRPPTNLDELLSIELKLEGFFSEYYGDDEVKIWLPEHRQSVDLYNPKERIAIEIEKTEKKRIVHDLLKLYNGGLTFVPKIRYGVLIFPKVYVSAAGNEFPFGRSAVINDLNFYFRGLFSRGELRDILCIEYSP